MRPNETLVSQPVRSLQSMLRVLVEDDPTLVKVVPDGFYGPQTQAAVQVFQRSRGLPATGVADVQTWDRIAVEYESAYIRTAPAAPIQLLLEPGEIIRRGDERVEIYLIQAMLIALSQAYSSVAAPSMSGILDEITADSIATFQILSGLPETGEVDKVTWSHMATHYPLATNIDGTGKRLRSDTGNNS